MNLKDFDQVAKIYQDSNQHDKYRKRLRGFDVHEPPDKHGFGEQKLTAVAHCGPV